MVKRILCILLCFALLCSFAGCRTDDVTPAPDGETENTDEVNTYPLCSSPKVNKFSSKVEAKAFADYLKENSKIYKTFFFFDHEGDEFDFTYYLFTQGGKRGSTDLYDFVSPSDSRNWIEGHIVLNGYECQCNEEDKAMYGECGIHHFFLIGSHEADVDPDLCILKYEITTNNIPEVIDASLLTFEPKNATGYNDTYHVKYDGQPLCTIYTCVPIDDTIRSLFTEYLVIYNKNTGS